MSINTETLNRRLFKILSKYKPTPLDVDGNPTDVEDEADVFKFTFKKDGEPYGTVYATVDNDHALNVYYGDDVTESPSSPTPGLDYDDTWTGLLRFLKQWAMLNQLSWQPDNNKDHLTQDMARRKHMKKKESIAEGYYAMGKKASYSDAVPTVKIVIEHTRQIEEGEQRYRNVNRIFLENEQGERILAPTTRPGVARVYARHLAEGGLPHDDRWNHIVGLCEEYNKMAGFVRATRNGQFNESTQRLVATGIEHYQKLRESLSKMTGKRGYNMYFENWTPALMEDEETVDLSEMFVEETLDPRIESVMPILSKLHKTVAEMKEVDALAEWADSLLEGGDGGEASDEGAEGDELGDEAAQAEEDLTEEESLTSNNPGGIPEGSDELDEAERPGLWANIHAKRERIKHGSGERMRKPGSKGAPSAQDFKDAAKTSNEGLGDVAKKIGGALKKVGGKALDTLGHGSDEDLLKDLQKRAGVPSHAQHGKPSMAKSNEDVDMGQYDAVKSTPKGKEDDEVFKKFREKVRQYGDELGQRQKEKEVDEGLDADQKRVGQLGPTEKVKNNNIGKLVGANESFINTDVQAVTTEDTYNNDVKRAFPGGKASGVKTGEKAPKGTSTMPKDKETAKGKPVAEGQDDLEAMLRIIRK
jgi:hypothetical protein